MATTELKKILTSNEFEEAMTSILEGVRDDHDIDSSWYDYEWVNDTYSIKEDIYLDECGYMVQINAIARVCQYTLESDYCTLFRVFDEDGNEVECDEDLRDYAEGFSVDLD